MLFAGISRASVISILFALAALTGGPSSASARVIQRTTRSDSAAAAAVVNGFHKALSDGDSIAALTLLADDVVILESGGVETRSEYRSHHLSGDIDFAKAVTTKHAPLKVFVEGNTAWTTATSTSQGHYHGRAINSVGAESMVLTRSSGQWKIRSIHWSSRTVTPRLSHRAH